MSCVHLWIFLYILFYINIAHCYTTYKPINRYPHPHLLYSTCTIERRRVSCESTERVLYLRQARNATELSR